MRELTPEECEFIAGGLKDRNMITNTPEYTPPPIVVTASPPPYYPPPPVPPYNPPPTGGGGGGGGEGDYPVAKPTPCVETTTPAAPTAAINNAALSAANQIAALQDHNWEYSAIVYVKDGQVGHTAPYTQNLPDKVNLLGNLSSVPNGAVIVGIVHNHPDQYGQNDGYPSAVDWNGYNQIRGDTLERGIVVYNNFLLYIHTNEDNKTRVYDSTDQNQQSNSCSLQ